MKRKLTTKVLYGCLLMSFSASTLAGIQNTKINTSLVPPLEDDPKVDFQLARVGWHLFRIQNCHLMARSVVKPAITYPLMVQNRRKFLLEYMALALVIQSPFLTRL